MTVRTTIARIIANDNGDPDQKARLILGYLHAIDFFSPGNGMLDDDPEMVNHEDGGQDGLNRAYEQAAPYYEDD